MSTTMTARESIKASDGRRAAVVLMLLLCGDVLFIGLYFVNIFTPLLSDALFNLDTDAGYAERYQYLKFCAVTVFFVFFSTKQRAGHYLAWALLFIYLLLDDSLKIHEIVGDYIAREINFAPLVGSGAEDFGELAVMAIAGFALATVLALAYRSGTQTFRAVSRGLIPFMLALFFCGVVVDMLHGVIDLGTGGALLLGLLEDGGEMFSASFILWHVLQLHGSGDFA